MIYIERAWVDGGTILAYSGEWCEGAFISHEIALQLGCIGRGGRR